MGWESVFCGLFMLERMISLRWVFGSSCHLIMFEGFCSKGGGRGRPRGRELKRNEVGICPGGKKNTWEEISVLRVFCLVEWLVAYSRVDLLLLVVCSRCEYVGLRLLIFALSLSWNLELSLWKALGGLNTLDFVCWRRGGVGEGRDRMK